MKTSNFQDIVTVLGQGIADSAVVTAAQIRLNESIKQIVGNGTGAGQVNCYYAAVRNLAAIPRTLTTSGSPTAGTVSVTVVTGGNYVNNTPVATSTQTATFAYNASTSAVNTALEALSNVGTGNMPVTGSAGAWVLTPSAAVGPVSFTTTNALTGGTTPTAVFTINGQVADATIAPTFGSAATTGGSLVASSTLYARYSYKNATGETNLSAEFSYSVPAGTSTNTITLTAPTLPTNATGINVYVGPATGREAFVGTSSTNTYVITALPASGALDPPSWNSTVFTSETLNLSSLTDPFGVALAFKGVSSIHVENPSPNNPMIVYGGSGTFAGPLTNAATGLVVEPAIVVSNIPTATCLHQMGYAAAGGSWKVQAGTNDQLRVGTYDPNGVAYVIILSGVR